MMLSNTFNSDLIWRISGFQYPERAVNFLKRFEKSFCVFSNSLRHLYTNYKLQRTGGHLVTLPNPYAQHDTFFNIPREAIKATPFLVVPGNKSTLDGWSLAFKNKSGRWTLVDLRKGMQRLNNVYGEDNPLLPIIINTNLRESPERRSPVMRLHRISVKELGSLSQLQIADIQQAIRAKMQLS